MTTAHPAGSLRALIRDLANDAPVDWDGVSSDLRPAHAVLVPTLQAIWQIGRAHAPETTIPVPGQWADLRVTERIGGGAFGDVYRARDPHLGREVALKILKARDRGAGDEGVIAEGHLLARVRHPNVVAVYGARRVDGQMGFWMELVEGTTLEDHVSTRGPLAAAEVIDIGRQLCAGVQALHDAGLVHGDIKPQNVMREASGRIVLMDLGAAHDLQARPRAVAATPRYMAPELASGQLPDPRSDVYSIGLVLHRLATGRLPGDTAAVSALDRRLQRALASACAVSREARPATARTLADMLAPAVPVPRVRSEWRMRAGFAAVTAITGALLAALAWSGGRVVPPPAGVSGPGVLVGQVANHAGAPEVDGLEHVVERELLSALPVVARSRVEDALALMQAAPTTPLTAGVAREVALRDGRISRYVTGRVSRADGRYVVDLEVGDPADGRCLAVVRETSGVLGHVPVLTQRLARRLTALLATSPSTVRPAEPLEPVTTRSLKALRLYSRAYELGERGEWPAALALVREVLDEQPDFAAARIWLAWALFRTGAAKDAYRAEAQRALTSTGHASVWERHWIRGSYHTLSEQYEAAIPEYLALIQLRPDLIWSYGNLQQAYRATGREAEWPASLPGAADAYPHSYPLNVMAMTTLLRRGQLGAAEPYAAKIRASAVRRPLEPSFSQIRAALLPAEAALVRGDATTALSVLREQEPGTLFEPRQPQELIIELFWFYVRMGRMSDADRMLDRIQPLRDSHVYGALLAHFAGDPPRLRRELASASVERPDGDAQWPVIAWLHVQASDLAAARDANRRADVSTRRLTSAHILLAERRYDEAIAAFSVDARALGPEIYWRAMIGLSHAWAAKGDHARAAAVLGPLDDVNARFTPLNHVAFRAIAGVTLAEAYFHLGRHTSSRPIIDHMRAVLALSEPDSLLRRRVEALAARIPGVS